MQVSERVYPSYQTHTQASGRHSIVKPPMQTLPASLEKLFLPDPGMVWWSFDWNAIELRILAAESRDPLLLEAFDKGYDLHTLTCCELNGWEYPSTKTEELHTHDETKVWRESIKWEGRGDKRRRDAKVFIFGLAYGKDPNLSPDPVAAHRFLSRHPAILAYHRKIVLETEKTGASRSFNGRLRRFTSKEGKEAIRAAFDHPMQGGCTDIYEEILIEIDRMFYPEVQFVYGTHDSQKWEISTTLYRRDVLEGYPLLRSLKDVAQKTRQINGIEMAFPITSEIIHEDGTHEGLTL